MNKKPKVILKIWIFLFVKSEKTFASIQCVVIFQSFVSFITVGVSIKKEIETVNKKHLNQQMALQRCKRDSNASKQIEKEISGLKMRKDFLKSNLMLERCNDAIARDRRQMEMLKESQRMEMEWE